MPGQANNYHIGRSNISKRARIPFTVNCNATIGSITATIDDEFQDSAEIFVAITTGASQTGSNGGTPATPGSVLDPSANNVSGQAFPTNLSSNTSPVSIGFVVLDGSPDAAPATIPLAGGLNQSPVYGVPQAIGGAQKLYSAEVIITDGAVTTVPAGTQGEALRAAVLSAGVTPNGNLKVIVTMPLFAPSGAATNVAPNFTGAATVIRGFLDLVWL